MSAPVAAAFCDQCGRSAEAGGHVRCAVRRELEPPRYCAECARRMVVQVTPMGWTARCSRHGEIFSPEGVC
ncbi:biotin synthase auxiliary protein BsaP [Pseudonocardia asaccharolytica]|uniref:biotin synthase auxiliary protein BsaP n=1 Tax=Pseudonocardia asaccharolytica TaxID=54010 RepID=UPI00041C3391|nr:hypothetical protein [Pseudonocardia asaccharolytica]